LGVNLRDLFPQHPVPDGWYNGKVIAVDGHNVAFRYLTSIRGRDGDTLRGPGGRVSSHLYGFVGLVRHLRERGAEPIVVWDGTVHPRKMATVEGRIQKRLEAALDAQEAKEAGDHEAHHRLLRATTYLDSDMIHDASRLLESLGVAVVRADHDAERYAAGLCAAGHAQAVATEDYDALVAGAPAVLRKAGSQEPFLHHLSDLAGHGLTGEQLRWVAILCGTDWNDGVGGFGAKTAVKALKAYPDLRVLVSEAEAGRDGTRWHEMLRKAGMTRTAFDELDRFIADVPRPPRPGRPDTDPGQAIELAAEFGVGRERIVACYC
jgi:flap endonuclease-1